MYVVVVVVVVGAAAPRKRNVLGAATAERVAETLKHAAAVCVVYNINDAHAHTIVYY